MAVLFSVFWGISTLFSIVAVLVCISTNSVGGQTRYYFNINLFPFNSRCLSICLYLKFFEHIFAIKKSTNNKCWRRCGEKGTFLYCWWECKEHSHCGEQCGDSLKKPEIELPYNSAIPLLGIHTKETRVKRDICMPVFIAALFTIAWTWKQPRCPLADKWIRKLWYIYTIEYYSVIKKKAFESVLTSGWNWSLLYRVK